MGGSVMTETPNRPLTNVPRHIAIIMDGNGRWAKARNLPRSAGHRAGTENLRRVLNAARDLGVEMVTVYAFSTENWGRPEPEVRILMTLLEQFIDSELDELNRQGVRIRHLGRTTGVAAGLIAKIKRAQEVTKNNSRLMLNVAFNYGGRAEIVDVVRQIVAEGIAPSAIDEQVIAQHLTTAGLPDPDLIIRTAGEMRLSNFLVWQAAYSEFYSTPTYWPDFDEDELRRALLAYQQRERRFGLLTPEPQ